MSKYIGRRVEAAIGLESSRGVGVTPNYALGHVDFSLFDKTVDARQDDSIGHIADSLDKFVVEKYAQGSISGILGANSSVYLMALVFGGLPTVGSVSDSRYPWTGSLSNTNQHKSASILIKDANQSLLHKLVMINQFEMNIELEDLVRFNAEFISKKGVTTGQSMPTYVNDYKFTKRKAKVYVASNTAGLDAATRLPLKSFRLTVNKNLTRDSEIGTVEPTDIQNQSLSIEGELQLVYNDQTYKNYMLNGDKKSLRIKLESENLIGASSYGDLTIDLPKVDFFGWEPENPNDEIVMNTVNFKANYDLTSGLVSSIIVRNALSAL